MCVHTSFSDSCVIYVGLGLRVYIDLLQQIDVEPTQYRILVDNISKFPLTYLSLSLLKCIVDLY